MIALRRSRPSLTASPSPRMESWGEREEPLSLTHVWVTSSIRQKRYRPLIFRFNFTPAVPSVLYLSPRESVGFSPSRLRSKPFNA